MKVLNDAGLQKLIGWLQPQLHGHSNKTVLDGIGQSHVDAWNIAAGGEPRSFRLSDLDGDARYRKEVTEENSGARIRVKYFKVTGGTLYAEATIENAANGTDLVRIEHCADKSHHKQISTTEVNGKIVVTVADL